MVRRFDTETVTNSRLPDASDIQGKIMRSHVQFTKTYRGAIEITWTVQEQTVASILTGPGQGSVLPRPSLLDLDHFHGLCHLLQFSQPSVVRSLNPDVGEQGNVAWDREFA